MRTYREVRKALKAVGFEDYTHHDDRPFVRDLPNDVTPEDALADTIFLDAWARPLEYKGAKPGALRARFPSVKPTLIRLNGDETVYDSLHDKSYHISAVPDGLYELEALRHAFKQRVRRKKDTKFNPERFRYKGSLVALTFMKGIDSNGLALFATPSGALVPVVEKRRKWDLLLLPGMVYENDWTGKYERIVTGAEYLKVLDAIHLGQQSPGFIYTTCVWNESLAEDFDRAPEVLAKFQAMLKLLPPVTIYAAVPTLVRYYGFSNNSQGGVIRRIDEPYSKNDNTLLFEGKAWLLLLAIDGTPVPGRVCAMENGRFVVSEWCFRETPEQGQHYEMFNGSLVKHTLLTWCAGPLLDRFGAGGNTAMFDGRAPDNDNKYRMQSIGHNKLVLAGQAILNKIIQEGSLLQLNALAWKEIMDNPASYPFGLLQDEYLYLCEAQTVDPYYGSGASGSRRMSFDTSPPVTSHREHALYAIYCSGGYHIPSSLCKMFFDIAPKVEIPQVFDPVGPVAFPTPVAPKFTPIDPVPPEPIVETP